MDLMEAIQKRYSCRAYADRPLHQEAYDKIARFIDELNEEAGLRFQLFGPREGGTSAIDMSDAMFTGTVPCYAALVAPDDPTSGDKVGYHGEKLVLFATQLGLDTCWVASTHDAKTVRVNLEPGDVLWDVIPIGFAMDKTPMKQQLIRAGLRKRDKKPQALVASEIPYDQLPEWFRAGIDSVILGPSAVNGQPVVFGYHDGCVTADLPHFKRKVEYNDLGIAKLHFQIAAAAHGVDGTWEWGLGGQFRY
ncbi:MAG: hypothetical protein J5804_05755 [Eggerthellaceae bacterium]|nr:hypothetical protein [Eggerthellaceae bacterium]